MKTIVSLALAGLMSISALLPALAAQEAESVSIAESSGISESVTQAENTASGSGSLAAGSSLPASDSMTSDEMDADSEPASGSETAESDVDAEAEDSSGVTAATADEQTVPVTVSEEYAILLATNQADSMMGHAGMRRSSTCKQLVESFILADYTADNEENAYKLLWAALNQAIVSLSEEGGGIGHCVYGSGTIRLYR